MHTSASSSTCLIPTSASLASITYVSHFPFVPFLLQPIFSSTPSLASHQSLFHTTALTWPFATQSVQSVSLQQQTSHQSALQWLSRPASRMGRRPRTTTPRNRLVRSHTSQLDRYALLYEPPAFFLDTSIPLFNEPSSPTACQSTAPGPVNNQDQR